MIAWIQSADTMILFWLALLIVFLFAEIITVGLTSIWFAAGALISLLAAAFGAERWIQITLFILVSLVLLIVTRPIAGKFVNSKLQKTNLDDMIEKPIRIMERVCNKEQTGTAIVEGKEWTVRSESDEEVIESGELVYVKKISGVKLIVSRK